MTKINTIILKKDVEVRDVSKIDFEYVSFERAEFDTDQIISNPHENEVSEYFRRIPKAKLEELLRTGETSYLLIEVTHVNHKLNSL